MSPSSVGLIPLSKVASVLGISSYKARKLVSEGMLHAVAKQGSLWVKPADLHRTMAALVLCKRIADLPLLVSVHQAAAILGLSRPSAYRSIKSGQISSLLVGTTKAPIAEIATLLGVLDSG